MATRGTTHVGLAVPDGIKAALDRIAADDGRSIAAAANIILAYGATLVAEGKITLRGMLDASRELQTPTPTKARRK